MLAGKVGEQLVEFRLIGLMLGLILRQVEVGDVVSSVQAPTIV